MKSVATRAIRILLVDDHALFREGLARLLEAEADFQLSAQCSTVKEALACVAARRVDVVLLDFDLGNERGTSFLEQARQEGYTGPVVILTAGVSDLEARDLLARGATGIFLKHSSPGLLAKCIRKVNDGEMWLDQHYVRALAQAPEPAAEAPRPKLTDRERQVLRGILEGLANKEIASRLDCSESAVKGILQQLFHKTGVRTRSQLVRIALEDYRDQL
jgi:DNA-binding NarL/FixJ family response regulator